MRKGISPRILQPAIATKHNSNTGCSVGNYPNYYDFRLDEQGRDTRLPHMRPAWFRGKSVLDIGCNNGWFTTQIALKFGCKKMMGVDIDPNLIAEAKANLTKHLAKTSRPRSPVYSPFSTSFLPSSSSPSSSPSSSLSSSPSSSPSPSNTSKTSHIQFISEDFISGTHQYEMFDTITCFSVSKWIHLNHGDEGIRKLFTKIQKHLNPGGHFIFEYQNWESYVWNWADVDKSTEKFLANNTLRPEQFSTLLQNNYGFELEQEIQLQHKEIKFNRPLLVLRKK